MGILHRTLDTETPTPSALNNMHDLICTICGEYSSGTEEICTDCQNATAYTEETT